MFPKRLGVASIVLLMVALLTQCTLLPDSAQPDKVSVNFQSELFKEALNRARTSAHDDQFDKVFKADEKVFLSGKNISSLSRFQVTPDARMLVVDAGAQQVSAFDKTGQPVNAIGSRGSKPGFYSFPTDVTVTKSREVAVSDFQPNRVNIYSGEGEFVKSFTYTHEGFSSQRILYDDASNSFYLFGNKWKTDAGGRVLGADLVHKYTAAGDYEKSFLPFPESGKGLDLYAYDEPAIDLADGNLVIALPFEYVVYGLDPKGSLTTLLKGDSDTFKSPSTPLDVERARKEPSYFQDWQLTWTPINNIVKSGDNLIVQYQTFSPTRYTIDVWSMQKKTKIASVKTNRAILTRDRDGYLYFLDNLDGKGQEQYGIVRAKIQIS